MNQKGSLTGDAWMDETDGSASKAPKAVSLTKANSALRERQLPAMGSEEVLSNVILDLAVSLQQCTVMMVSVNPHDIVLK